MTNLSKPRLKMTMRGGQLVPIKASYEGASQGRRMSGKGVLASGPNMPLARSLPLLQARSRHATRNNPYAAGARESYVANLVGTGIRPHWKNRDIQALWDRWVKQCDAEGMDSFYGLQAMAAASEFEAGEILTRFRIRRPTDGLAVPLQLQLLESDHLDPGYSSATGQRLIKMGIEFNPLGQRTAYHLWRYHPHEKLTQQFNERVAVPAESVLHMYRRTRPGQLRGSPALTSVIVRLYEIDEMQDALLARQKLAQLFGAFVKRKTVESEDDLPELGQAGTHVSFPGEAEPLNEFTPGAIHFLDDDEEVTFSDPPDIGSSYDGWLRSELLAVARGAGITYEQLTGDLKGVNYSSIRAGLLEFRRRAEALQAHLIVHQWCNPIAARFLDVAVVSRAISLPEYWARRDEYLAIGWIAPKWSWVDPLKEVTADLLETRSGFAPRSEKAAERGYGLEELDDAIAEARDSAAERGLVFDSDAGQTAKSGAIQSALEIIEQTEEQ